MKNQINLLAIFICCWACNSAGGDTSTAVAADPSPITASMSNEDGQVQVITGETMGTTYSIKYVGELKSKLKKQIDDLLVDINAAVSTYEKKSIISDFNRLASGKTFHINDYPNKLQTYFLENFLTSRTIQQSSIGHFDPTVMPIVNYWGFGYDGHNKITKIDSTKIRSILSTVGFNKINFDQDQTTFTKTVDGVELDFSAVAKGYAVDKVALVLDDQGVRSYYVEIGGECKAKGKKLEKPWVIGVNVPDPKAGSRDILTKIDLVDMAAATSGNYRNFYELDGEIISHTINAKTGFPERNNLLSATVFSTSCAQADALATACMSMGFDQAFPYIDEMPGAECYLVYTNSQGQVLEAATGGIGRMIH